MLKIYSRILISAWKTFGVGIIFLRWLFLAPLFVGFTHLTLFLDNIFFSPYRQVEVKNPVFIIGHPRSGTTFLHRLLTQTNDFAVFRLWHILLPSLTARTLLKPLVSYLSQTSLATLYPDEVGHKLTLNSEEEEEVLFMHKLDTQFVLLSTPLAFDDREHPEIRFHDRQPQARRQSSIEFFKSCLQRHIFYTGKAQIVAKPNYSIQRLKTLMAEFPDAKFIYLVRSPYETILSHLSLHRSMFDHHWGLDNIPADKLRRYFERRYRYNIELYRYFYELQKNREIPEDRVMVVKYHSLRSNLAETFAKIITFTGIQPSDRLRAAIEKQDKIQGDYHRKHKIVELEEFGLTRSRIAKDLSFVFEEYELENYREQTIAS